MLVYLSRTVTQYIFKKKKKKKKKNGHIIARFLLEQYTLMLSKERLKAISNLIFAKG